MQTRAAGGRDSRKVPQGGQQRARGLRRGKYSLRREEVRSTARKRETPWGAFKGSNATEQGAPQPPGKFRVKWHKMPLEMLPPESRETAFISEPEASRVGGRCLGSRSPAEMPKEAGTGSSDRTQR